MLPLCWAAPHPGLISLWTDELKVLSWKGGLLKLLYLFVLIHTFLGTTMLAKGTGPRDSDIWVFVSPK